MKQAKEATGNIPVLPDNCYLRNEDAELIARLTLQEFAKYVELVKLITPQKEKQ
jgi:hypothetical protein